MSSSARSTSSSTPCRFYNQGYCRYGDKCKFSHNSNVQHTGKDAGRSDPVPCRAWKAGTCARGAKCWYSHDLDVQKPGVAPSKSPKQQNSATTSYAEHVRTQESEAAAAHKRAKAIKEEAAKTITQVVSGSIVTFSAGLDVSSLIPGFETCTLCIGNFPVGVGEDDVRALLRRQGFDGGQFQLMIKRRDHRVEARIVTDMGTGCALAWGLDGMEFEDEALVVETSATNSLDGMNAGTGQSPEILTISWHAPSARYIVEYADADTASAMVEELNRSVYLDRRIKVQMNAPSRGRKSLANAIKINNLPPSVTDEDVLRFTGSIAVRRVTGGAGVTRTTKEIAKLVRDDIERAVPGGLKQFDGPPNACNANGVVSARAHFSSWDEANVARGPLLDKHYGNQPVWLRLPVPMFFTLTIPAEQYKAQKAQWNSLSSPIKDKKACSLNVRDFGNSVSIRLSGSVKEATGALKVRVENLARGHKVEGWHYSLGAVGNPFVSRVYSHTGAYLRADRKQQSLKVYGAPRAVDEARKMIKNELDRLSSLSEKGFSS